MFDAAAVLASIPPESKNAITQSTIAALTKLFGPAADEVGQLFGEVVRSWRVRLACKTVETSVNMLKDVGVDPKTVPLKT